MKVSEITEEYLQGYLKLDDPTKEEMNDVRMAHSAAVSYTTNFTGLSKEELDKYEDITAAVLILTTDFFDNRALIAATSYVNKSVECILAMHSINLL